MRRSPRAWCGAAAPGDGRPPLLRPTSRSREPAHRRLHAARGKAAIRPDVDLVYSYFPRLEGAGACSTGRLYLRRRSRDVRHRPRADVAAEDDPCSTSRPWGLAPQLVERFSRSSETSTPRRGWSFLLASRTRACARYARHGYVLEKRPRGARRRGQGAVRDEDVKEFYSAWPKAAHVVPRGQAFTGGAKRWLARVRSRVCGSDCCCPLPVARKLGATLPWRGRVGSTVLGRSKPGWGKVCRTGTARGQPHPARRRAQKRSAAFATLPLQGRVKQARTASDSNSNGKAL